MAGSGNGNDTSRFDRSAAAIIISRYWAEVQFSPGNSAYLPEARRLSWIGVKTFDSPVHPEAIRDLDEILGSGGTSQNCCMTKQSRGFLPEGDEPALALANRLTFRPLIATRALFEGRAWRQVSAATAPTL
jgi:hypothetical protein